MIYYDNKYLPTECNLNPNFGLLPGSSSESLEFVRLVPIFY